MEHSAENTGCNATILGDVVPESTLVVEKDLGKVSDGTDKDVKAERAAVNPPATLRDEDDEQWADWLGDQHFDSYNDLQQVRSP